MSKRKKRSDRGEGKLAFLQVDGLAVRLDWDVVYAVAVEVMPSFVDFVLLECRVQKRDSFLSGVGVCVRWLVEGAVDDRGEDGLRAGRERVVKAPPVDRVDNVCVVWIKHLLEERGTYPRTKQQICFLCTT